eukprot:SAG22_NODE_3271_length_1817_cov_1.389988_3_plen_199_part_01
MADHHWQELSEQILEKILPSFGSGGGEGDDDDEQGEIRAYLAGALLVAAADDPGNDDDNAEDFVEAVHGLMPDSELDVAAAVEAVVSLRAAQTDRAPQASAVDGDEPAEAAPVPAPAPDGAMLTISISVMDGRKYRTGQRYTFRNGRNSTVTGMDQSIEQRPNPDPKLPFARQLTIVPDDDGNGAALPQAAPPVPPATK